MSRKRAEARSRKALPEILCLGCFLDPFRGLFFPPKGGNTADPPLAEPSGVVYGTECEGQNRDTHKIPDMLGKKHENL